MILEGALLNAKEALDTKVVNVEHSGAQQHTNADVEEALELFGDSSSSSSDESETALVKYWMQASNLFTSESETNEGAYRIVSVLLK